MNIGFFTETYFPQMSGVSTSVKTLKDELEKMGHHVFIFTSTDPNAIPEEEVDIIRLPSIPLVSYEEKRVVIRGVVEAMTEAKKYGLDIIHSHNEFGCGLLGKLVAKNLKIPVIHTYHTMYEDYLHYIMGGHLLKVQHIKPYIRWFMNSLAGIVAPSNRVKETLRSYGVTAKIRVIPTGIEVEKYIREDITTEECLRLRQKIGVLEDEVMLLHISRVGTEKNIDVIVDGMPEILAAIPNVKLVIVGDGPYKEELIEKVKRMGIEQQVHFTGQVEQEETPYYYHCADYFVFASVTETQGLTYTEAMASGVRAIVQGNEYVDALFDHESLGVTFVGGENFAKTAIDYIQADVSFDEEVLERKLYEISSVNFAQNMYEYYLDGLVRFTKELRERSRKSNMQVIKEKVAKAPLKLKQLKPSRGKGEK